MKSEKVYFENTQGERLAARMDFPVTGKPGAFAMFAHCFTCNKNFRAIRNINAALTRQGFAVFRFDFTGLGESEGDFADTNFSSNVEDLVAAAKYLADHYEPPQLLVGHSLGGAAALLAGKKIESVHGIATIAAPAEPVHVEEYFGEKAKELKQKGELEVKLGGRPFKVKKQLLDDLERVNMEKNISDLRKALLVMHSPQDKIVGIENAARIYKAAIHPKSFITLDGADHLLMNKEDSTYAGKMIASWASRYIEKKEIEELTTDYKVVIKTAEGYFTDIKAQGHELEADEPEDKGGTNLGPTPYALLLSALGACTGITLRMYANRKEWPLESIKVHLNHHKTHADDCEECEQEGAMIDRMERVVELEGDLDEKQRKRLLQIANKCPVHKTLHNGNIKIKTELKK